MSIWRSKPNRETVFVILMIVSGLSLVAPPGLSDSVKHIVQFMVPAQDLGRTAVMTFIGRVQSLSEKDANDEQSSVLLRELAAERALNLQLESEVNRLRGLREGNVPPAVPLLDARVVARDIAVWRDSALVARGSLRGVGWKDWVASRFFINRGSVSEVQPGQVVLARECLIGRVDQVSPYMARVRLLSDKESPRIAVRIASRIGDDFRFIDFECSLRGAGMGKMSIENVEARYIESSSEAEESVAGTELRIKVGDLVYTSPDQFGLPAPMVVGRITEITENPLKRLVYNLVVEPLVTIDQLHDVFVIPLLGEEPLKIP